MPPELEREEDPQDLQQQDQGDTTVVNLDDDDDDDLGQPGAAGQDPDVLDRRGRRSWAKQAKADLAERDKTIEELRREMAELRGHVQARPTYVQAPQQQQQQDPVRTELGRIRSQMQNISRVMASKDTPPADLQRLEQEYYELDDRRIALAASAGQQRQEPQQQVPYEIQVMRAEFPVAFQRPELYHEMEAEFARLRAANGGQHGGLPMMKAAAQKVYARHGIGQRPAPPTREQQAKFTGTSARAGAGSGAGSTYTLSKGDRRTAIAYWDNTSNAHLSDDAKVKLYVRNVLSKPDAP